jgi:hypothetical protein
MACVMKKKTWAGTRDWETHKSTISKLYGEELKSLVEVMSFMEETYKFFAT